MELIDRLINVVFPIFAIVAVGYFYARKHKPDMLQANKINMDLFTPILIFSVLSGREIHLADYGNLVMAGIVVVLLPGLLTLPLCLVGKIQWKTLIPPMMFRNSGNMGLPLFLLAFGEEALPAAIMLFIVENTLHFTVGMYMLRPKEGLLHIIKIPMVQATILGLIFAAFQWKLPSPVQTGLDMAGQIAIPLMLFALGVRLTDTDMRSWKVGVLSGIWAPISGLVVAYVIAQFVQLDTQHYAMLLVFAALPPAVLNYLVAEKYNQQPDQVASIVLIGNVLSVVSIPLILAYALSL